MSITSNEAKDKANIANTTKINELNEWTQRETTELYKASLASIEHASERGDYSTMLCYTYTMFLQDKYETVASNVITLLQSNGFATRMSTNRGIQSINITIEWGD